MLSPEFKEAVRSRNVLRTRIMIKDAFVTDPSCALVDEMLQYAKNNGLMVYDEPEEYTQNQTESDSTGYEIHQNSLAEDIYIYRGTYVSGAMTEEQKAEFRSYGENAFYSAWQDAMYSDVYRCWGRYGYLVAWEQFGDYLDFYEGIFGSERLKDYDSIYNNAPTGMETDDEAGYYVDEVLALAEKNNADMIFN